MQQEYITMDDFKVNLSTVTQEYIKTRAFLIAKNKDPFTVTQVKGVFERSIEESYRNLRNQRKTGLR